MQTKDRTGDTLCAFIDDFGIPDTLIADLAGEQSGENTEFLNQVCRHNIRLHHTEKGRHNQNHQVELEIGILKQRWKNRMSQKGVPSRLWDYGLVYEVEILTHMCRHGSDRSGYEELTGNTPNISEWLDFAFYNLVWYHVPSNKPTTPPRALGHWLGVSHRVGSALCYWILTRSGKVISSTTVNHVTQADTRDPHNAQHIRDFDSAVRARLEDTNFTSNDVPGDSPYIEDYSPPEDAPRRRVIPSDTEYGDMIVEEPPDDDEHEDLDNYIHAQLLLDVGNEKLQGRVTQQVRTPDGTKKGKPHRNPMFDTRAYLVEFSDGSVSEYTANIIAENIYSQVDQEGRSFTILSKICGHKHDRTATPKGEGSHTSHNGNRSPKKMTRGWKFQVLWKDGTTEWVSIKALKERNPVELADYAKAHHIDDEPAFYWWVRDVLRKRQKIIGKLKSKYWHTTHKFGIRLP